MKLVRFLLLIILLFRSGSAALADTVTLRTGKTIEGTIIKQTSSRVIIHNQNKQMSINRSRIIRINYDSKLYRVIVRMTNGTEFFANLIGENTDHYTFKKYLKATKTFIIKRRNISFIVPASPVNVTADTGATTITLKWDHPYKTVKYYNIYLKKENNKYKLSAQTSNKEFTFKGLVSNTVYSIKITSIDIENEESQAATVNRIKTKNITPDPPYNLKSNIILSDDKQKMDIKFSWTTPEDPDGTIIKYHIYKKNSNKYILVGKTRSTEYIITNLDPQKKYNYSIRSVDNLDAESKDVALMNSYLPKKYFASIQYNYVIPTGTFSDVSSSGSGLIFNYTIANIISEDVLFQASAGIISYSTLKENVSSLYSVPVSISIGYMYSISNKCIISPYLGGGIVFYNKSEREDEYSEYKYKTYLAPQARISIDYTYKYSKSTHFFFNTGYTLFFEKNNLGQYASLGAGVQFLL